MQIVGENIFSETVPAGIRTETQSDIILRDAVADDLVFVALVEGKADGVFAVISFCSSRLRSDD